VNRGAYRSSIAWRAFDSLGRLADQHVGWDKFPRIIGVPILLGARNVLRRENLVDTSREPARPRPPLPQAPRWREARSPDGTYNDLEHPEMGRAGSRFGRNVPIDNTWRETDGALLDPSPRELSRKLMTRKEFQAADNVNSLAAAWLQFMIRDWFHHPPGQKDVSWTVPLENDDCWPGGGSTMKILKVPTDPDRPPGAHGPLTYANEMSHWWDASSVYGDTAEEQDNRRSTGGRLMIEDGLPPVLRSEEVLRKPGYWLGLGMLHALFTLEHNAICEHLGRAYPYWSEDRLFDKARLVNCALIAKIHTVEWTPAVIDHPTTVFALKANWWGLQGQWLKRRIGRLSRNEVISGIVGSGTDHFGVPYSLTEEFVAVYRMHPMLRDDWTFRAAADGACIQDLTFRDLTDRRTVDLFETIDMEDLFYSFATLPAGLVTLHNYPHFLQQFERPENEDGERPLMDLAATDILRTRELGVPRYNDFRRLVHLRPVRDFLALTGGNEEWAEQIRELYGGNIERVDLLVGMYAEPRPQGFAFSDTALRIFVVMASRRLNSDRFFTDDYRPDVYTREGLDWVDRATMRSVLERHLPELGPALASTTNAFKRWDRP
jgi:hypothetical protein